MLLQRLSSITGKQSAKPGCYTCSADNTGITSNFSPPKVPYLLHRNNSLQRHRGLLVGWINRLKGNTKHKIPLDFWLGIFGHQLLVSLTELWKTTLIIWIDCCFTPYSTVCWSYHGNSSHHSCLSQSFTGALKFLAQGHSHKNPENLERL